MKVILVKPGSSVWKKSKEEGYNISNEVSWSLALKKMQGTVEQWIRNFEKEEEIKNPLNIDQKVGKGIATKEYDTWIRGRSINGFDAFAWFDLLFKDGKLVFGVYYGCGGGFVKDKDELRNKLSYPIAGKGNKDFFDFISSPGLSEVSKKSIQELFEAVS
jgi:hypothetical protein